MPNIVFTFNGYSLEHLPGAGYRVWHPTSSPDIIIEPNYKDENKPKADEIFYTARVALRHAKDVSPDDAQKIADNIVRAARAADHIEHYLKENA